MERSMLDADTFLTTLYVVIDDFCKAELTLELRPGPAAALSCSEVLTLAIFGQWQGFGSERGFYRYARHHLRAAFPTLPARFRGRRRSVGATDGVGSKACACCWLSRPRARSPALPSRQAAPKISRSL